MVTFGAIGGAFHTVHPTHNGIHRTVADAEIIIVEVALRTSKAGCGVSADGTLGGAITTLVEVGVLPCWASGALGVDKYA